MSYAIWVTSFEMTFQWTENGPVGLGGLCVVLPVVVEFRGGPGPVPIHHRPLMVANAKE